MNSCGEKNQRAAFWLIKKLVQSGTFSSGTEFLLKKKIVKWKQVKITNMILQRLQILYWFVHIFWEGTSQKFDNIFIFTWNYLLRRVKKDWRFRFIFVTFSEYMNLLSLSLTFGHHKLTFCERILCTASIDHACKTHPLENWFLDLFFVRLNRLQCAIFFSHQKLENYSNLEVFANFSEMGWNMGNLFQNYWLKKLAEEFRMFEKLSMW